MKVQFKLTLGGMDFLIEEECETQAEFIEKVSFFSNLPKVGPNGEDDLVLTFRTTTEGYKYYSIVSKKADQEYKFGQSQKNAGELFGKGWEPLYKPENAVANGGVGVGATAAQPAPQQQFQQPAANVGVGAVQPQPTPQPQQVQQPVQQAAPQPQQVQQPAQQAAPVQNQQVNNQVQQQNQAAANDVLAQFGITN